MVGNKRRVNASRRKQPPATITLDREIKQCIEVVMDLVIMEEYEKALDIANKAISTHPSSGHLRHLLGKIHQGAYKACKDGDDAKIKHLQDGVYTAQLAVKLLPNSICCASFLALLIYDLASFNEDWDKVIEVCQRALEIENPTSSGVEEVRGLSAKSRTEEARESIQNIIRDAGCRKAVKLIAERRGEQVDTDFVMNMEKVVLKMNQRKKKFEDSRRNWKQKMSIHGTKKVDSYAQKIVEYKRFWAGMSDGEKRGFQKVKIEDLRKHCKSLKYDLGAAFLSEAINFAKKNRTWKYLECTSCVKKFGDYESYRNHLRGLHWMDLDWKLTSDMDINKDSIRKIVGDLGKSVESSMTSVDDPKCEQSHDAEHLRILERVCRMFNLLLEKDCLASSHVRFIIEYEESHHGKGLETLENLGLWDASELGYVIKFLQKLVLNCGLSESEGEDKVITYETKDIGLSGDFILIDDFNLAADHASSGVGESEDAVLPSGEDIVSWLLMGSTFEKELEFSKNLIRFNREQALNLLVRFERDLLHLPTFCRKEVEISSQLVAVEKVEDMIQEEIRKRGEIPEQEQKAFFSLIQKRQEELQMIHDSYVKPELKIVSAIVNQARGFDQMKEDDGIKKGLHLWRRMFLEKLSDYHAIVLRYERELAEVSAYDYRSMIVPLLKSFLQRQLEDMFKKDAAEKSETIANSLLEEEAREVVRNQKNKGSGDVKQKLEKKKKEEEEKLRQAADNSKHSELHQKDAKHHTSNYFDGFSILHRCSDNPNCKSDSSHDLPKLSTEGRLLEALSEKQGLVNQDVSAKFNASGSRTGKLLGDPVGVNESEEQGI